ncbi:MAG: hypothetical protein ACE5LU_24005, partial [Anaerolineae bacterium]
FERHTLSFILRLWVEPVQQPGEPRWRGQIEHVDSGEKVYFQVPAALVAFLAQSLRGSSQREDRENTTQEEGEGQ